MSNKEIDQELEINGEEEIHVDDLQSTNATETKSEEVDYKEKYTRLLAEYSNALKQKDAELKGMAQFGQKNLLTKFIDIIDDLEMGMTQEGLGEETKKVLELLHAKMAHLLQIEGVTEIEVKPGDVYDASLYEVITTVEDEANKGKVAHIARKGYLLGERVLRTAKVVVGK